MAKAYYIHEWASRYEVTSDGRAAKKGHPIEKLQKGPLSYIRLPANGHAKSAEYQRLEWAAKTQARLEAANCVFPRLLQMAGDQDCQWRGWVLDERQRPATPEDIASFNGYRLQTVKVALEVLAYPDVGWIELRPFEPDSAGDCGTQQNTAEPLANETETNPKKDKENRSEGQGNSRDTTLGKTLSLSDISKGFGSDSHEKKHVDVFVLKAEDILQNAGRTRTKLQRASDRTCLKQFAEDIVAKSTDPKKCSDMLITVLLKLNELARDPTVEKPMAVFTEKVNNKELGN